MAKRILIIVAIVIVAAGAYIGYLFATSRSHSPFLHSEFSSNGLDIGISYCRPYKKGRVIFGDASVHALQPNGKYWRLGANDATEITFNKNVIFGGKPVAAGKYRMYAVPNAATWQISLNSGLGQSGATEPDYNLDVVKVDVPVASAPETEQLTIMVADANGGSEIDIVWDTVKVVVPVTIQ
jgi:Protein of unknown function (DUF2911)